MSSNRISSSSMTSVNISKDSKTSSDDTSLSLAASIERDNAVFMKGYRLRKRLTQSFPIGGYETRVVDSSLIIYFVNALISNFFCHFLNTVMTDWVPSGR